MVILNHNMALLQNHNIISQNMVITQNMGILVVNITEKSWLDDWLVGFYQVSSGKKTHET